MLEAFYKDNYRIVYGYLLSLCGDPVQAEDLASETFVRAMERIGSFDPRYEASTWLCTIGRNLYLNQCKRRNREVPLEDAVCAVPSPEALYLQKEQAAEIIRAAKALSPEQRQVLFLRLEGLPFRDIAAALGKTETWARVTYYRVKGRIIAEMEEKA